MSEGRPVSQRRPLRRRLLGLAGLGAGALLLASCSLVKIPGDPMSAVNPQGPYARSINNLFWPVFWIAAGVFVVVEGLLLVAVLVFRDRPGRKEPKQVHGNAALEVTWTVIPALILATIAVPTVRNVFDLTKCPNGSMSVQITGHQWWFEYTYPQYGIDTANVLVIPAGRPVCATMTSADVIHNFWVPELNGKRYLIPGQTTILPLQADKPGEYWAQCGEFCGLSHSLMRARVLALPEDQFQAWVQGQQQPAAVPAEGSAAFAGWQLYQQKGCTACHDVTTADQTYGPAADAFHGPNLTHQASRDVFAGAYLPLQGQTRDQALTMWLSDPPAVKPGSYMPNLKLTQQEIQNLIGWLDTLK